ncbi:hypothetical protein [Paenibacillus hexagrammi]|uniref:Uncharacterized protein n=1 Tax=Paenibacillus hexagrammi TaxID=2908839 RepID=A0ABY3ST57_9BACL|nr:hypothetical protein [Paenibacillus sp. YPD9-1]UJF36598.1 hypothetical protein L0M14_30380 [Paenibacillus sp. YPD9-1]
MSFQKLSLTVCQLTTKYTVQTGTPSDSTSDVVTRTIKNKNHKQDTSSTKKPKPVTKKPKSESTERKSINEGKEIKDFKGPNIVEYFAQKYKEKYGDEYIVSNYEVSSRLVKLKLLPAFGPEKTCKIIDVVMQFYDQKWATVDYPRPTIAQLATWLANRAVVLIDDKAPLQAKTDDEGELDYEELMKKFRNRG